MCFQVEVPIVQQCLLEPLYLQSVAIVGVHFSSPFPADVLEMPRDSAKASGAA
jgi:hypothetical protein